MYKQIVVEETVQAAHSRRATVQIGNKMITTPCYGVLLKKAFELDLFNRDVSAPNLQLIGLRQSNAPAIIKEHEIRRGYRTLTGEPTEQIYIGMRNTKFWFVDPCTDLLYYKAPDGKSEQAELFAKYSPEMQKVLRQFTPATHDQKWQELCQDEATLMRLIRETCKLQMEAKADFIVPPVPLITADSPLKLVDNWVDLVKTTGVFAKTNLELPTAIPLFIHFNCVKRTDTLAYLVKRLNEEVINGGMAEYKMFLLRVVGENLEGESREVRERFKLFIQGISRLAREAKCAVALLDIGTVGLLSIAIGADAFIEPLSGVPCASGFVGRSKDKHGRYYHPEGMKMVRFADLKASYDAQGQKLPCECTACDSINGNDLAEVPDGVWNETRRRHLVLARNQELNEANEAIADNTIRGAISEKVQRSDVKNLLDILP